MAVMAALVPLVFVGWVALGVALYRRLPGTWATLIVFIAGHLFLPEVQGESRVAGVPDPITLPLVKLTKTNKDFLSAMSQMG